MEENCPIPKEVIRKIVRNAVIKEETSEGVTVIISIDKITEELYDKILHLLDD
jgi:hypothetical protein